MVVLGAAVLGLLASPASAASGAGGSETAQAHRALLVVSDLPAGWTSTPSASSNGGGSSFTGAPQLASCLGVPRQIVAAVPPEVNSAQMSNPGGTLQVQDTISIYPSATFAQEEFATVSSRKAPACLQTLLNATLGGSSGSATTAHSLSVAKAASPKGTTAFDLDTALTSQGQTERIREEIVLFVHGQLAAALEFMGYGSSTLPPSLVQHLTSLARSRL